MTTLEPVPYIACPGSGTLIPGLSFTIAPSVMELRKTTATCPVCGRKTRVLFRVRVQTNGREILAGHVGYHRGQGGRGQYGREKKKGRFYVIMGGKKQ